MLRRLRVFLPVEDVAKVTLNFSLEKSALLSRFEFAHSIGGELIDQSSSLKNDAMNIDWFLNLLLIDQISV